MPDLDAPATAPPAPQTQTQTQTQMQKRAHSHLLTLPLELHHLITSHLSIPAYLALRLAHPHFYYALPASSPHPSTQPLDPCARLAIRTYLAPYLQESCGSGASTAKFAVTAASTKNNDEKDGEEEEEDDDEDRPVRCALCGQIYPKRLFSSTASPACTTQDFSSSTTTTATDPLLPRPRCSREIIDLPDRVCAWHVSRLARTAARPATMAQAGPPPPPQPRWTSRTEPMCMHCGAVVGWRACRCACSTCGVRAARTYTRWVDRGSGEVVGAAPEGKSGEQGRWRCVGFVFWRDAAGGLWVRERRAKVGAGNGIDDADRTSRPMARKGCSAVGYLGWFAERKVLD